MIPLGVLQQQTLGGGGPSFLDNFNGSVGNLNLHTPDTNPAGNPWVKINQNINVDGAGLAAMATNGQRHHYQIDLEASDGVIEMVDMGVWRHGSSSPWAWSGVAFRSQVGSDRYLWYAAARTHVDPYDFVLVKCNNQTIDNGTVIANDAGTNTDGRGTLLTYDATITLDGDSIRYEVPAHGVDIQITDSFNETDTAYGLAGKWFNNNFCSWESIAMSSL